MIKTFVNPGSLAKLIFKVRSSSNSSYWWMYSTLYGTYIYKEVTALYLLY
jgi:hypothetical protein